MILFEHQKKAKKTSTPSINQNSIIIPVNMPGYEILLPSTKHPVLNEHPYSNEGPILEPAEYQKKKTS